MDESSSGCTLAIEATSVSLGGNAADESIRVDESELRDDDDAVIAASGIYHPAEWSPAVLYRTSSYMVFCFNLCCYVSLSASYGLVNKRTFSLK